MTKTKPPTIGTILSDLRQQHGLTVYELAKRSGILQTTIARIESGENQPRFATMVALARALHVSLDTFAK